MPAPPGAAVPPAPAGLSRILLRLPNWLGDVVMAGPAVAAIARARPEARITAEAPPAFLPLAARLPGVAAVLPAGADRTLRQVRASARALRDHGFDAAVVFPRSTRAALAPRLARIPVRIGYRGGRATTHRATGWRALRRAHRTAWFGLLARAFEAAVELPFALAVTDRDRSRADRLLLAHGRRAERPLVVLEPGASYGAAKCWPPGRFGALARALVERGFDVATIGLPASRGAEARVRRAAGVPLLRLAGETPALEALLGVLDRADLVVANDTGPMHVAAALGTPTLALFGASDPVVSAPAGPGPVRILYDPEPCSPCFLRTCPAVGHPCLAKIGVPRVLAEALALAPVAPA